MRRVGRSLASVVVVFLIFALGVLAGRRTHEPKALAACGTCLDNAPPLPESCLPGDLNGDRIANLSDAVYLLGHLFLGTPAPIPCTGAPGPVSKVIIVRHGERDSGADDCPEDCPTECINADGHARAQRLSEVLRDVSIDHLISSDLCRTAQTLAPTAADHDGLAIEPVDDPEDVASFLLEQPAGSTSVVAHHSFSIHCILESLGLADVCDVDVSGSSYDNLLVVLLPAGGAPELLRLHY